LNKEYLLNPFRVSFGFACQPGVLRRAKLLVACGEKPGHKKQSRPLPFQVESAIRGFNLGSATWDLGSNEI
jgi:hypothetical protein